MIGLSELVCFFRQAPSLPLRKGNAPEMKAHTHEQTQHPHYGVRDPSRNRGDQQLQGNAGDRRRSRQSPDSGESVEEATARW